MFVIGNFAVEMEKIVACIRKADLNVIALYFNDKSMIEVPFTDESWNLLIHHCSIYVKNKEIFIGWHYKDYIIFLKNINCIYKGDRILTIYLNDLVIISIPFENNNELEKTFGNFITFYNKWSPDTTI